MKKNIFLLYLLLSLISIVDAQEFIFQLNFTDAIGNKDSLLVGYDITATDTIDNSFGEVNIFSSPIDSVFDVRVSNVYTKMFEGSTVTSLQLKKQIIENINTCEFNTIAIDIYAKYWPVTATWNNLLFNNSCLNGSVFTSIHPGGWWDTGSESNLLRTELAILDSVTFSSNNSGNLWIPGYIYDSGAYLNSNNDTTSVFWLKIGDSSILNTSLSDNLDFESNHIIYPNPNNGVFNFNYNLTNNAVLSIYNNLGQEVKTIQLSATKKMLTVNMNNFDCGIYTYKVTENNQLIAISKFIVN